MATVSGVPGIIVPVCWLNTDRVTLALPVPPFWGAITRVYVPEVGNATEFSIPDPPHTPVEARVDPFGLRMLMLTLQAVKLLFVSCTLANCPAVPLNVYSTLCPGVLAVTV